MSPQEVPSEAPEILKALRESRVEFIDAAAIAEEHAKTRPTADRWSVLDCVEHLVIAETRFLDWLENPKGLVATPADREKEAKLLAVMASRENRVQAPDPVQPTGRFPTLAAGLHEFETVRARVIAFAEQQGAGLYSLGAQHVFFGPLNGAEVMCMIAAHARRHAAQMREIREQI